MMSGVILAGGNHNGINGTNRAFLVVDGETLLQKQIREMQSCCNEITIVTNDPQPFLRTVDRNIRIITDYFTGNGLLSGMHAGLSLSQNNDVWILGCHMPFPSSDAAKLLLTYKHEGVEAVIPWVNGKSQPLHGIYDRSCAARIGSLLNSGSYQVSALLNRLRWSKISEPPFEEHGIGCHFVQSIRTEGDYARLVKKLDRESLESIAECD
ncbi:molybdenum cofactor guanylyltransferase [Paenibacillus sp. L3-i20]|uniref:molybdenum cofactor guanylyltransferase n=1 Tax=Paenibacillus sp. L3-i20 TaxID=2905833 RepID=UPI001EE04BA3|nr:molybdenum cofactor guanylyltransferase [Paenibacillus sp. L3-i20]GKU78847.1 putative molybdenum cofactor guanylyltransferase [Paenibacillus sp. L3-i20]